MRVSKATPEDISQVQNFFFILEALQEYDFQFDIEDLEAYEDSYFYTELKSIVFDNYGDLIEDEGQIMLNLLQMPIHGWRRIILACDILIRNCCNPDVDYLDWHPKIKSALEGTDN